MTPLRHLLDLAGASLEAVGAALADIPRSLNHESHRIAVTGLQRSGKTVFVTSFVHALRQAADAPVADFPFFPWRGQVRDVSVADIPGIPPFPYRARLGELLADPPAWPERTTGLSGIRVRIRHTPTAGLTRMLFSTATVDLDLIDYPGEWLLDLPMLTQSYPEWSAQMEVLASAGSRAGLSRAGQRPRSQANLPDWRPRLFRASDIPRTLDLQQRDSRRWQGGARKGPATRRRQGRSRRPTATAPMSGSFVDFGPTRAKMEGRAPCPAVDIRSPFPDRLIPHFARMPFEA